jgi:hypothetical protein
MRERGGGRVKEREGGWKGEREREKERRKERWIGR